MAASAGKACRQRSKTRATIFIFCLTSLPDSVSIEFASFEIAQEVPTVQPLSSISNVSVGNDYRRTGVLDPGVAAMALIDWRKAGYGSSQAWFYLSVNAKLATI
jgi:hypothetical protein